MNNIQHENFLSFHGVYFDRYHYDIVMEKFDGLPLNEILENDDLKQSLMSNKEKKNKIHQQLCDAMAYMHENHISSNNIDSHSILVDLNNDKLKIKSYNLENNLCNSVDLRKETIPKKCEGNIPAVFQNQEDKDAFYNEWSCEITCEFLHEVSLFDRRSPKCVSCF